MSADGASGAASMVLGARDAELPVGGAVIHGHYYMPREAANVFNNYVSPGLSKYTRSGATAYEIFRAIGNTENQFELGLSGFHLGATTIFNSLVSDVGLGLGRIFGKGKTLGERASGAIPLARAASVVGSIGHTMLEGAKLQSDYLSEPLRQEYEALREKASPRAQMAAAVARAVAVEAQRGQLLLGQSGSKDAHGHQGRSVRAGGHASVTRRNREGGFAGDAVHGSQDEARRVPQSRGRRSGACAARGLVTRADQSRT